MADLVTKEDIEKMVDKIIDEKLENYFRMSRPGFNIESGTKVPGHGIGEFCLTTDTIQGLHFYEHGHAKIYTNKSIEIYAGEEAGEKDMGVVIESENGNVKITAKMDNLILQGNNVKIQATEAIQLRARNIVDIVAPTVQSLSDNLMMVGVLDSKFLGGDVELYARTTVEIESGVDDLLNLSLMDRLMGILEDVKRIAIFDL